MSERIRLATIGIKPRTPFVLWDYDLGEKEDPLEAVEFLSDWAQDKSMYGTANLMHRHYSIRATKNGYHLIMEVESWDTAQAFIDELHKVTGKQSILNCRKQRIRIAPKWSLVTGKIVSGAPISVIGCIHHDKWWEDLRTGILEFYFTYDKGLDTGLSEDEWKILGESK